LVDNTGQIPFGVPVGFHPEGLLPRVAVPQPTEQPGKRPVASGAVPRDKPCFFFFRFLLLLLFLSHWNMDSGLGLARQALYHLSHTASSLFCLLEWQVNLTETAL
jgi:hypothetical protein